MPDASDNLALVGVACYSKGGSFQRMILAPKDSFNELLCEQLFSSLFLKWVNYRVPSCAVVIIALGGCCKSYFVLTWIKMFVYTYLYCAVMQSNACLYI